MIKKLVFYYKVLYKGELLKKIEYKIKDKLNYFKIRTKKNLSLINNVNIIKCTKPNFEFETPKKEAQFEYYIFEKKFKYDDLILNIKKTKKQYWRSLKLNEYDDIKEIWELNRLQFLLPLLKKFYINKEEKTKDKILNIINCWNDYNPYELSLNWNSNLEIAIRSINIYFTMITLDDYSYKDILFYHGLHLYNEINYSEKCIPNNHVISEATALLVLSSVFDGKLSKKWYKKSIRILRKYINSFDKYGVSNENSFSYQFFITKMYILSLCYVREERDFISIENTIKKSLLFLKYCIVNKNEIFNYGDNDNGFLYSFDEKYSIVNDIERYYNFFISNEFNSSDFEISFYKNLLNTFQNFKITNYNKEKEKNYFLSDKIFIYNDKKVSLCFNAKNINGHAHNDSLAIILYIDGMEVLADAGTYSYNKSSVIRTFYRSREAHSTILIKDNAFPIATFRWLNKENSYLYNFIIKDNKLSIEGIIGKNYRRKVTIMLNEKKILIHDYTNDKYISTSWIFSNDVKIIEKNKIKYNNLDIIDNSNPINIKKNNIKISKKYLNLIDGIQIIKINEKESKVTIKY